MREITGARFCISLAGYDLRLRRPARVDPLTAFSTNGAIAFFMVRSRERGSERGQCRAGLQAG